MSQEPGSLNEFGLNLSGAQIEWRWADEENSTMSYDERVENSWQFEAEAGMFFRIAFLKRVFIYYTIQDTDRNFLSKILAYQIYC
jgi:hypothetical protein